jgi:flagellar assembly protein FliH
MASYSKIFKASQVSLMNNIKVISQPTVKFDSPGDEENPHSHQNEDLGTESNQDYSIIEAAKAEAEAIIINARQQAHSLEMAAEMKINQWWEENQKKFEEMTLEAQQHGYQEGFELGRKDSENELKQQYREKMEQIQALLQQAYIQKENIIAESEPFLLELSTVIASQIVKQELNDYPEKFVELIKQHILRVKEKESITVCVHPNDFDLIQAERSHLVAMVNGDTEIKIIPDHSVSPKGCIIRTAYGSVDARIDTQIEEIKKVILEVRRVTDSEIIS